MSNINISISLPVELHEKITGHLALIKAQDGREYPDSEVVDKMCSVGLDPSTMVKDAPACRPSISSVIARAVEIGLGIDAQRVEVSMKRKAYMESMMVHGALAVQKDRAAPQAEPVRGIEPPQDEPPQDEPPQDEPPQVATAAPLPSPDMIPVVNPTRTSPRHAEAKRKAPRREKLVPKRITK